MTLRNLFAPLCLAAGSTLALTANAQSPVGFASLNGGTTGGAGGNTVSASTGTEIHEAICARATDTTPLIIEVSGTITPGNTSKVRGSCNTADGVIELKDIANITLIGVGGGALFNEIGIHIRNSSNIILRNLRVKDVKKSGSPTSNGGDAIGMEKDVSNVWVDHCTLEASGGESDGFDALIDMKNNTKYVTISYNHLKGSDRGGLVGAGNSDSANNYITFHHNFYEDLKSRTPLLRFATSAHSFNNYFKGIRDTGINARRGAKIRVENNYFENSRNPLGTFFDEVDGYWQVSGNFFSSSVTWEAKSDQRPAGPNVVSTTSVSIPYSYSADDAGCVPQIVQSTAGANKGMQTSDGNCSSTPPPPPPTPIPTSTPSSAPTPTPTPGGNNGDVNCSGVNEYPNWPRRDWPGGEPNHAEAGDQMQYQGRLYSANWYTSTVPGSDASWNDLGACD